MLLNPKSLQLTNSKKPNPSGLRRQFLIHVQFLLAIFSFSVYFCFFNYLFYNSSFKYDLFFDCLFFCLLIFMLAMTYWLTQKEVF